MSLDPRARILPAHLFGVEHTVAVERIIFNGKKAGLVRPILEDFPFGQKLIQQARLVIAQATPQNQVRAARDNVYGINLQCAHAPYGFEHIQLVRSATRARVQTRRRYHHSLCLSVSQFHLRIVSRLILRLLLPIVSYKTSSARLIEHC